MMDRHAEAHRLVDFLNTLHLPDGDDRLADERASAWLSEWLGGDDRDRPEVTPEQRTQLQELREGLRELIGATSGATPDAAVLARAGDVLRAMPLVLDLGPDGGGTGLACHARSDLAGRALASVAAAFMTVRTGDEWSRIKTCAASDCRWGFYDTSRNRSRRWCDMSDCGNRAKNRGWRERQKTIVIV